MINDPCALSVAQRYGLEPVSEGRAAYRCQCPVCRADNMTFVPGKIGNGWRFYSNCGCYAQDGYNSGTGENLDFWLRELGAVGQAQPDHTQVATPEPTELDSVKLRRIHEYTKSRLAGSPAQQYALSRGLTVETQTAWRFGYGYFTVDGVKYDSITIPWHDQDRHLVGLSHRLINPPDKRHRAPWQGGMAGHVSGLLCGWHTHKPDSNVLIIIEGILNAPSAFQVCQSANVLTPGTDKTDPSAWPLDAIRKHDHVIVWADKEAFADKWAAVVGGNVSVICSPVRNGIKLDANEMLQRGILGNFLDRAMPDQTDVTEYVVNQFDVTEYVGKTLTETDLERLKRRLIEGWSVDAKRVADGLYRVARLIAVPV
jgi:hypothetical protein